MGVCGGCSFHTANHFPCTNNFGSVSIGDKKYAVGINTHNPGKLILTIDEKEYEIDGCIKFCPWCGKEFV